MDQPVSKSDVNYSFLFGVDSPHLSSDQAAHVQAIGKEFCMMMAEKYTKGQKEHGGNIWDTPPVKLVDCAIEEAIDQVVYLLTLRRVMRGEGV